MNQNDTLRLAVWILVVSAILGFGYLFWSTYSSGQPQVLWEDDFSTDKSRWGINSRNRKLEKSPVYLPKDYEGKPTFWVNSEKEVWTKCRNIKDTKKPFFVSVTVIPEIESKKDSDRENASFGLIIREYQSQDDEPDKPVRSSSGRFYMLDLPKSNGSSISLDDKSSYKTKVESRKPYRLKIEFSTTSVNFYINETLVRGENDSRSFEPNFSFLGGGEIKNKCVGFFTSSNQTLYFYDFVAKSYIPDDIQQELKTAIGTKDGQIKDLIGRIETLEKDRDNRVNESGRLANVEMKLEGVKNGDTIPSGNEITSSEPVGKRLSALRKDVDNIISGKQSLTVLPEKQGDPSTTLTEIYEIQRTIWSIGREKGYQGKYKGVCFESNLRKVLGLTSVECR